MRHRYECPLRWADLDLLGHVNNVVYVDYLQEARVDMLRHHRGEASAEGLVEGLVVVRHEVSYLAPLVFRFAPVSIECWVVEIRAASFTMGYEVFDEHEDGSRTVYLRASTVLTPYVFTHERPRRVSAEERLVLEAYLGTETPSPRPARSAPHHEELGHYPVHVRFSDVDIYGHVNNVVYFEYIQEARISLMARLWPDPREASAGSMVVARTDVDYRVPILQRQAPYDAWSWVSHVGTTSAVIETEILDGDVLLARARVVMVFVDADTGRSRPPAPEHRDPLAAMLQRAG
ncbi:acyl-CoA thioesterase YbgC [Nocardioides dokdonensis FR1436]|uniref:Acyl-CoA thioesterase YbgC n=1 Tax=Nocardioides dokdonensis FR1436 TaxID=1300347 RepID=A0A1A9GKI7_9ACTN|nr:thioesterase family protein [Nocardioides dokdonensis]ANH38784.1 acyl-CoA thioesterase YbgC [Nocardioides dokdonensis FR1436]